MFASSILSVSAPSVPSTFYNRCIQFQDVVTHLHHALLPVMSPSDVTQTHAALYNKLLVSLYLSTNPGYTNLREQFINVQGGRNQILSLCNSES